MAECPHCKEKLHFWNIKAECPHCGSNIPNHNWEERLEEDAVKREESFYKMHSTLNKLKFAVVGTPLRIIRFIFAFLPIIGYVVPLGAIKYTTEAGQEFSASTINAIALFTKDTFKIGELIGAITADLSNPNARLALISMLGLAVSLLFGVIAFFLIPILCKKPKQPVTMIAHLISLVTYSLSPVFLGKFIAATGAEGAVGWGYYVGIALFAIAFILDIIVLTRKIGPLDGKYIPDANKDELQAEYAESIGEPFKAKAENSEEGGES